MAHTDETCAMDETFQMRDSDSEKHMHCSVYFSVTHDVTGHFLVFTKVLGYHLHG